MYKNFFLLENNLFQVLEIYIFENMETCKSWKIELQQIILYKCAYDFIKHYNVKIIKIYT